MTGGEHLVTAPVGTRLEEARRILHEHRLEKLPLVDDDGPPARADHRARRAAADRAPQRGAR